MVRFAIEIHLHPAVTSSADCGWRMEWQNVILDSHRRQNPPILMKISRSHI